MKILYLVRHAKSSWKHPELTDKERPLSKRGNRDAPLMGKLLMKREEVPELLISSPALRAHDTAKAFAEEFGIKKKNIKISEQLYMPSESGFYELLYSTDDKINKLMLFSHNPGITEFANKITGLTIDNIPTAGVIRIDFETENWNKIKETKGILKFFEYPRKHNNA
jgi:phosphohistidine phosphatase